MNMDIIAAIARQAREAGMSYGKYIAQYKIHFCGICGCRLETEGTMCASCATKYIAKKKKNTKCVRCNADISNRGTTAKYCYYCSKIVRAEQVMDNKRKRESKKKGE